MTVAELKLPDPGPVLLVRADPRYPGVWAKVSPYLDAAINRGNGARDWLIEDVYEQACAGWVQLWVGTSGEDVFGACICREINYPRRKVLDVLLMGAEPHSERQWLVALEQLKSIARQYGCECLMGTGRPGWSRKIGADRERLVWECDL